MKKLLFMGASVAFLAASCGAPSANTESQFDSPSLKYVKELPDFPEELLEHNFISKDYGHVIIEITNKGDSFYDNFFFDLYFTENSKGEQVYRMVDSRTKKIYLGSGGIPFLREKCSELRKPNVKGRVSSEMYWIWKKDTLRHDGQIYENGKLVDAFNMEI